MFLRTRKPAEGALRPAVAVAAMGLLCALAGLVGLQSVAAQAGRGYGRRLVYQKNSLYHRIFVYREGSLVTLQFGRPNPYVVQSQVDLSDLRRHVQEYSTLAFCGLLYQPEPQKALVVGLGGGVIPRELRHYYPALEIDVAEIDPEIPPVAKHYFGFETDEKLVVHVADGRMFVKNQLRADHVPEYDLIVLDAFNADYIPFHLMTREFLQELQGVLADDGVVVANVFYTNRLYDAEFRTFLDVFGRCQVFGGARSGNAMLVALGPDAQELTPQQAAEQAAALQREHNFDFNMRWVATRFFPHARPHAGAMVLTDDRAPVNRLREQPRSEPVQGGPADAPRAPQPAPNP